MFRLKGAQGGGAAAAGDLGEDKENRTPTLHEIKADPIISHAMTMPPRSAARVEGTAAGTTPCFVASETAGSQSRSAPGPKALRNVTNTGMAGRRPVPAYDEDLTGLLTAIVHDDKAAAGLLMPGSSAAPSLKRPAGAPLSQDSKRPKAGVQWVYSADKAGCAAVSAALDLGLSADITRSLGTPVGLFRHLEESGTQECFHPALTRLGQLSSAVLRVFSQCPGIDSLNLTPTYGFQINDLGLVKPGALSPHKCTVPLFSGFAGVRVVDLTNVHIVDDDLRFLIRLERLQALGLSGTKITNKGLKYLATHAGFKGSLRCIKLCYVEGVSLAGLEHLCAGFKRLSEADLWGCEQLALADCKPFLCGGVAKLRLPAELHGLIDDRHHYYGGLSRRHPELLMAPVGLEAMGEGELKRQLKMHKPQFTDIYLNLPVEALRARLGKILAVLEIQERLYALL